MKHARLLNEIDEFLSEFEEKPYNFGFGAVRNGRLVERLRAGKRIWPDTEACVRAYIRRERKLRRAERSESAA